MAGELVDFEARAEQLVRQGRRVGLTGSDPRSYDEGHSVEVRVPTARGGAALLVHKERAPEMGFDFGYRCTKCRGGDVVIVIGFPGGDGEPIHICRTCVDRPVDHPLVIQFRP